LAPAARGRIVLIAGWRCPDRRRRHRHPSRHPGRAARAVLPECSGARWIVGRPLRVSAPHGDVAAARSAVGAARIP